MHFRSHQEPVAALVAKNSLLPYIKKKQTFFLIIMPIVSGPFSVDKLEGN